MNQWIGLNKLNPGDLYDLGGGPYSSAELERMNYKFVVAMAAAIRAGLERPFRVGIDRTPGTKNPVYVAHGASKEL